MDLYVAIGVVLILVLVGVSLRGFGTVGVQDIDEEETKAVNKETSTTISADVEKGEEKETTSSDSDLYNDEE